jgi:hypothetical protein
MATGKRELDEAGSIHNEADAPDRSGSDTGLQNPSSLFERKIRMPAALDVTNNEVHGYFWASDQRKNFGWIHHV